MASGNTWVSVAPKTAAAGARPRPEHLPDSAKVDLNSADISQLAALPSMSFSYASEIVANRPYRTMQEVADRTSLPDSVLKAIWPSSRFNTR